MLDILDKVFTDEKAADDECWAGTSPFLSIWSICIVDGKGDLLFFQCMPLFLEITPP